MSEDDQVRRLLADARHTDPIPADVASRMDRVIADLRADRPVRPAVTDLAAARRRRRARTLLVAAAAVVVAGIGIDQLRGADLGSSSLSGGSGSDSSSSDAGAGQAGAGGAGREQAESPQASQDFAAAGAVRISSARFTQQVRQLRSARHDAAQDGVDNTGGQAQSQGGGRLMDLYKDARCRVPGPGRVVPVRYDGAPGLLVYRPATRDSQVVDLILCGHSGITRTITLPAP